MPTGSDFEKGFDMSHLNGDLNWQVFLGNENRTMLDRVDKNIGSCLIGRKTNIELVEGQEMLIEKIVYDKYTDSDKKEYIQTLTIEPLSTEAGVYKFRIRQTDSGSPRIIDDFSLKLSSDELVLFLNNPGILSLNAYELINLDKTANFETGPSISYGRFIRIFEN